MDPMGRKMNKTSTHFSDRWVPCQFLLRCIYDIMYFLYEQKFVVKMFVEIWWIGGRDTGLVQTIPKSYDNSAFFGPKTGELKTCNSPDKKNTREKVPLQLITLLVTGFWAHFVHNFHQIPTWPHFAAEKKVDIKTCFLSKSGKAQSGLEKHVFAGHESSSKASKFQRRPG